jgi:hypothetical protein
MKHVDQAFPQSRGAFDVEGPDSRTMVRPPRAWVLIAAS